MTPVVYKTARDRFYVTLWVGTLVLITLSLFVPLLFTPIVYLQLLVVGVIEVLVAGLIIWLVADLKYVLTKDHLIVRGGFIQSKIKYSDITKVTRQPNIWAGYRMLFSRDAIEVHYRNGLWSSVIISPLEKEAFIEELKSRNYGIYVEPLDNKQL
ncbi:PH domain-containing protein [Paenibacillus sp. YPG26]|uniref:PH domain-containing protein n=1 Tax=Paenibacillus sp. YPG26 TaxID=2878915 RepID=UPI002041E4B8|nr:PH domain-containing protein [Paenibacillus sp. YPG26]USB34037.1 PH domain-containing protein [Paenibacillus sp. YPG26]